MVTVSADILAYCSCHAARKSKLQIRRYVLFLPRNECTSGTKKGDRLVLYKRRDSSKTKSGNQMKTAQGTQEKRAIIR